MTNAAKVAEMAPEFFGARAHVALLGPGGEELEYDVKPPRPNKSRLSHVRTPLTKVELSGVDFVLFSRKFLWVKFHCRGVPVPPLETLRLRLRALTPMSSSTQW